MKRSCGSEVYRKAGRKCISILMMLKVHLKKAKGYNLNRKKKWTESARAGRH